MKPARAFAQIIIVAIVTLALGVIAVLGYQKYSAKPLTPSDQKPIISTSSPSPEASTKPNEAGDWTTYTNTKHKFLLKVPQNKKLLTTNLNNGECSNATEVSDTLEVVENAPQYCGFLGEKLPNNQTDFAVLVLSPAIEDIYNVLGPSDQKLTVSESPAAKYKFTEESALPNVQATRIYVNHADKTYLIFLKQYDKMGNYDKSLDQILSTFKFTN